MSTHSPHHGIVVDELEKTKQLADKPIGQLDDEQLHIAIDPRATASP